MLFLTSSCHGDLCGQDVECPSVAVGCQSYSVVLFLTTSCHGDVMWENIECLLVIGYIDSISLSVHVDVTLVSPITLVSVTHYTTECHPLH